MEQHGYYGSLRTKYLAAGWLEQPARGVYRRTRGDLTWEQTVQALMHHCVTVGGRTVLELEGFARYLSQTQPHIFLYGDKPLPGWVAKLPIEARFMFRNRNRLFPAVSQEPAARGLNDHKPANTKTTLPGALRIVPWGHWTWPLITSTPERALFELLDELPDREFPSG